MNPTQKQFSLERAASKKQFPISRAAFGILTGAGLLAASAENGQTQTVIPAPVVHIRTSGNNVVLTTTNEPFAPFAVEKKSSLTSTNWTLVNIGVANNLGVFAFTDTNALKSTSGFYRVQKL